MQTSLRWLLRSRPGEGRLLTTLGVILAASMLAEQVAAIVAMSGFLASGSVNGILVVWIVDMAIGLAAAVLYAAVIDRYRRRDLLAGLLAGLAVCYGALVLAFAFGILPRLAYAAVVILVDLQWVILPLVFWVLASDQTDMAQAQRLFPVIAGVGFVGRLAGIFLSLAAPGLIHTLGWPPGVLLAVNVVIYLLALGILLRNPADDRGSGRVARPEPARQMLSEGWQFVREVPAFRFLGLAAAAGALALTVIEFHFLAVTQAAVVDATTTPADDYQRFYSLYRLGLTVASLIVQGVLTSRIIQRLTLKNAFVVLPLALLGGSLLVLGAAGLAPVIAAFFLTKLTQTTVDQSAVSALRGLIPEERRGRVALFVSAYIPSAATIVAAALIGGILVVAARLGRPELASRGYLTLGVLAGGLAVWAAAAMRASYETSLLNWRLKRRQRGGAVSARLEL